MSFNHCRIAWIVLLLPLLSGCGSCNKETELPPGSEKNLVRPFSEAEQQLADELEDEFDGLNVVASSDYNDPNGNPDCTTVVWRANDFSEAIPEKLIEINRTRPIHFLTIRSKSLTEDDFELLQHLTHVRNLTIQCPAVTDEVLAFLGDSEELQVLIIEEGHIEGEGLEHLAKLSNLQAISLRQLPIRDQHLGHLTNFPALTRLDLGGSDITDEGLGHLVKLSSLNTLILSRTQVTDEGIQQLTKLKNLKNLLLTDTAVSDQGDALLKAALPRIHIVH